MPLVSISKQPALQCHLKTSRTPLLNPQNPSNTNTSDTHTERTQHIGAALSDLLAPPPVSWGPAVLLEPLLLWAHTAFPAFASPLTMHMRLLVVLADAGVELIAGHLVDASPVQHPNPNPGGGVPRAVLAQTLVRLMLALSALDPGRARLAAPGGGQNRGKGEQEVETRLRRTALGVVGGIRAADVVS
ncbi:hypothetical protein DFH08DRAFT_956196 [Mycena albidolilacea]|uniref:Uncharacterized protein n=1 Tax=Mycena albidolilacea TaxID=1033008 RepID=A0AAD7AAT9_9AGAR|nr:hypothetical protein DFH08DRAFT_956196 [Mycena albidolilacea]